MAKPRRKFFEASQLNKKKENTEARGGKALTKSAMQIV